MCSTLLRDLRSGWVDETAFARPSTHRTAGSVNYVTHGTDEAITLHTNIFSYFFPQQSDQSQFTFETW